MTLEELQAGVVLLIDKPYQWTSFQVVGKIKSILRRRFDVKKIKIGHAGTLDPLATGLLLVCIGKATKTIGQLQSGNKTYSGTMVLGATTPCFDMEQPISELFPVGEITEEMVAQAAKGFEGNILQVPPMFSAVKVNGQRAYKLARKETDEEQPEINAKPISVYSFTISNLRSSSEAVPNEVVEYFPKKTAPGNAPKLYNNPQTTLPSNLLLVDFNIHCGKGTYVRSLARDLGLELGNGAFLYSLRRESIGDYQVKDALKVDQIEDYLVGLSQTSPLPL